MISNLKIIYYFYIWCILNLFIRLFGKNILTDEKNIGSLTKYIISGYATYSYIISHDINLLIGYYFYSLIITIAQKNVLFTLHHIGALICAFIDSDDSDYQKMMQAIYWLKISDTFSYIVKVFQLSYLSDYFPNLSHLVIIVSLLINLFMCIVYRVILPIQLHFFDNIIYEIIAILFHIVNIWWVFSIYKKIRKITGKPLIFNNYSNIN